MDDRTFDRLTASLAPHLARRRLLGGLLGAAAAVLPAWAPPALACPRPRRCGEDGCCRANQVCLDGECAPRHCADGRANGGETDVDCGGTCRRFKRCGLAQVCERQDDCGLFALVCTGVPSFCPGARPGVKRCFRCRTDLACLRDRPRCLCGFCRECLRDEDCPVRGGPAGNRFCVAPLGGDCPADHPCVCRECRTDADCPPDKFCDEQNTCVQSNTCATGQDFCLDGIVGCNGNPDCVCRQTLNSEPFCAHTATVVCGCSSEADCTAFGVGPGTQCVRAEGTCGSANCQTICALPCG